MNHIPIYVPDTERYKKSAHEAIDSGWVSNYGKFIQLSENKLKEILGVKHCILMNTGTAATHCLYIALKLKYPDIKKIYIPNGVFIAPWNTGLLTYPIEIFEVMRTNPETLNIVSEEKYILSLEQNSAMVVVHNYGNIVNVPRLKRLRPDMIFIEDNCEGLFGKYEGRYSGTESLCSSCSFYSNKTVFTGEGGAFFTNDDEIYNYMKTFYSHGMTRERYVHDRVAVNYRMTNIQAAFLYDQLNDLDTILSKKKVIMDRYANALSEVKNIKQLSTEENTEPSNWMFIMLIDVSFDRFEKFMTVKDIDVRPLFYDIHRHKHLTEIKKREDCLTMQGAMLPSYPGLSELEQNYIINSIKEFFS